MTGAFLLLSAVCVTGASLALLWAVTHLVDEARRWWEDRKAAKYRWARFDQMDDLARRPDEIPPRMLPLIEPEER